MTSLHILINSDSRVCLYIVLFFLEISIPAYLKSSMEWSFELKCIETGVSPIIVIGIDVCLPWRLQNKPYLTMIIHVFLGMYLFIFISHMYLFIFIFDVLQFIFLLYIFSNFLRRHNNTIRCYDVLLFFCISKQFMFCNWRRRLCRRKFLQHFV
jgi:hypothetical protein